MARFILPTPGTRTQGFGGNAAYYAQYGQKGHNGFDIGNKSGTPARAAGDGTVYFEGWGKNNGWLGIPAGISVLIDHGDVYSGYAHMSSTIVSKGQTVKQGQIIGYMGATGAATGPHTHFEFLPKPVNTGNGYYGRVNPDIYLNQSSGGNSDMTPNFIKRTYYMVANATPSQAEVDFHMAKSNPESFINGFGDSPLWKRLEAQRNSLIAERDNLQNKLSAEQVKYVALVTDLESINAQLNVANQKIAELDAEIVILKKEPRTGQTVYLDDYSLGSLLSAAFAKLFKIK